MKKKVSKHKLGGGDYIGMRLNGINGKRGAFSAAEMLVVILIISFLVLAMPPFVHKKFKKRITRAEHGRYECWYDDDSGNYFQYWAAENSGACSDNGGCEEKYEADDGNTYYVQKLDADEYCTFDPEEIAPDADYFFFNAVGGGAGGSYAPYKPDDEIYKGTYSQTAEISLTSDGDDGVETDDLNAKYYDYEADYKAEYGDRGYSEGKGKGSNILSCNTTDTETYQNEYLTRYLYTYKEEIDDYDDALEAAGEDAWVSGYWIPVPAKSGTICSSDGYSGGTAYITTQGASSQVVTVYFGSIAQYGFCAYLNRSGYSELSLGADDVLKIFKSNRTIGEETVSIDDVSLSRSDTTTASNSCRYGVITGNYDSSLSCNTCTSCYLIKITDGVGTVRLDSDFENGGEDYGGNYVYVQYNGDFEDTSGDFTLEPAPNGNKPSSSDAADDNLNISCTTTNQATSSEYARGSDNPYWSVASQKSNDAASVSVTFPSTVTMEREYGYDSTTFGYAGEPGESVSLFLSKLEGELTIKPGEGGDPGTYSDKESSLYRAGENGGDTIIWYTEDFSNADDTEDAVMKVEGGIRFAGGEIGERIMLFGDDILTGRDEGDERLWSYTDSSGNTEEEAKSVSGLDSICIDTDNIGIDGCLDRGASGIKSNGSTDEDHKRFSESSGFYTVIELDEDTATPSVIEHLDPLPGSGGDGGYSFLTSAEGEESITYSHDSEEQGTGKLTYNHTDYLEGLDDSHTYYGETLTTSLNNYKCYKYGDSLGSPSGTGLNGDDGEDGDLEVQDGAYFCKPGKGHGGAVVIVW